MSRLELIKQNVSRLLKDNDLKFIRLLEELRHAYGVSRKQIEADTGICEQKLTRIEGGRFRLSYPEEMKILAKYYSIPEKVLLSKMHEHIQNQREWTNRGKITLADASVSLQDAIQQYRKQKTGQSTKKQ